MTKQYTAFDESKSLAEWSRDARCRVSLPTLYKRVRKENVPLEEAMTTPPKTGHGPRKPRKTYTAFSEAKTAGAWARDERCIVTPQSLNYRLKVLGWPIEKAMTWAAWKPQSEDQYTAFDETKSLSDWAQDPRCVVDRYTLGDRVRNKEWSLEEALTTPKAERPLGPITAATTVTREGTTHNMTVKGYEAFDLVLSAKEWAEQTGLSVSTVRKYAKANQLGAHLTQLGWCPGKPPLRKRTSVADLDLPRG
ncbi:hypothetical protein GCM10010331_44330 [Streptomyces xanthochromogenes]|uniref:hypothetical protein n=1 Tax=Streptomyces xanthochromogenes TaxID=67384 RepID=UPI0016728BAA|nr:hypothetical protein [Streptomyces xanthochromogenes]GHB51917.1 hypothetical protein GCM10010331_44330 [Streptomyces xanthochromogenes]